MAEIPQLPPPADFDLIKRAVAGFPHEEINNGEGLLVRGCCSDVMDAMIDEGAQVNCILTDPPWMSPAVAYPAKLKGGDKKSWAGDLGIMKIGFKAIFSKMREVQVFGGNTNIFCGDLSSALFQQIAYERWSRMVLMTWVKSQGRVNMPFRNKNEFMMHCSDGLFHPAADGHAITPYLEAKIVPSNDRIHPAQKPEALLETLVRTFCPPGGVVMDCFAGSHSIVTPCFASGRRYLCIEDDEEFNERACERWAQHGQQGSIL